MEEILGFPQIPAFVNGQIGEERSGVLNPSLVYSLLLSLTHRFSLTPQEIQHWRTQQVLSPGLWHATSTP